MGKDRLKLMSTIEYANGNPNNTAASAELQIDIPNEPALWWPECNCCIYNVPQDLREQNSIAYTPRFVSIGPMHHNEENLKRMEKQKKIYYAFFLVRLLNRQASIDVYKAFLKRKEEDICRCYSKKYDDHIFDDKDEFVNMILLDAVFIMELFLRSVNNLNRESDLRFTKPWIMGGIKRDLLLLENQLPMFVLVELYKNFVPEILEGKEYYSFHELAYKYFLGDPEAMVPNHLLRLFQKSKHFTDMFRYVTLPSGYQQLERSKRDRFRLLKTAVKLDQAGITFEDLGKHEKIEFKKKKFLDMLPFLSLIPWINCAKARLEIPKLHVEELTEVRLRNIIALEQCHYPHEQFISSYIALLDRLIDTEEDADFLIDKKIISHTMGSSKKVVSLFNNLLKEVYISSEFYGDIIDEIQKHCDNPWNIGMARLKSVYFCNLWRGSLTVVGVAVFFFSIFNSVHNFLKYI